MAEYRWAEAREEEELLDLINFVFSQADRPHDFSKLIPKVYAHPGFSGLHAVAAEGEKLIATVAMLPVEARLDPSLPPLRGGFIGSVSAHPRFRGAGHMGALMRMQIEEARARDYDFMVLGGQRQRYGYFGFENACGEVRFSLNRKNAVHALPEGGEFSFERVTAGHPALPFMAALHEKQPLSCARPRDRFFETFSTFEGVAWIVKKGGEWAGYLAFLDDMMTELALTDENDLPGVLGAWLRKENPCVLLCSIGRQDRIRRLKETAESAEVGDAQMLKVLNWGRMLEKTFRCRALNAPLPEGRRVLRVKDAGAWALEVQKGGVSVMPSDDSADLVLSEREAVSALFSPLSSWLCSDPLLRAWLPLPFYIPIPDHF